MKKKRSKIDVDSEILEKKLLRSDVMYLVKGKNGKESWESNVSLIARGLYPKVKEFEIEQEKITGKRKFLRFQKLNDDFEDSEFEAPRKKRKLDHKKVERFYSACRFINQGNSCYFTSILIILFSSKEFLNFVLNVLGDTSEKGGSSGFDILRFEVLTKIIPGDVHYVYDPIGLFNYVLSKIPFFEKYKQQDSQEFFTHFIEFLKSEIAEEKYLLEKFNSIFSIQLGSSVICQKCSNKTMSKYEEQSLSISLVDGEDQLKPCLYEFFSAERLQDSNKFYCCKCSSHQIAIKKLSILRFPKILVIHFNRFYLDSRNKVNKNYQGLEVPDILEFFDNDENNKNKVKYNLYAIDCHRGSANQGHYFCYVKRIFADPPKTRSGRVILNSENHFTMYSDLDKKDYVELNEITTKNMYILFYERLD